MEISLILGVVVGVVLGLTGAGGGILAVPALVIGMGWSVQEATPVALIAVASGAALGAFDGLCKGLVRYKAALVMGGAIVIGLVAFTLAKKRVSSLLGLPMQLPTARQLDRRLILGSLTFGIGWGLAGICPGPALVLLGEGVQQGALFIAAMLAGMGLFEWLERRKA